jgi:hypothetical protein
MASNCVSFKDAVFVDITVGTISAREPQERVKLKKLSGFFFWVSEFPAQVGKSQNVGLEFVNSAELALVAHFLGCAPSAATLGGIRSVILLESRWCRCCSLLRPVLSWLSPAVFRIVHSDFSPQTFFSCARCNIDIVSAGSISSCARCQLVYATCCFGLYCVKKTIYPGKKHNYHGLTFSAL